MGWDAHSTPFKLTANHKLQIINPKHRRSFKNASNYVKRKEKIVDWLLEYGGLDCSDCAEMLQKATGMDCWGENLSWQRVKSYAKKANWDFCYPKTEAWAYWSARKFLETCAKLNLPIRFIW